MSGTETIGFIGLGNQGEPIALRIAQAGFPLVVWARREAAMARCLAQGARAAASVAALGSACDQIGICVLDDAGVMEVCDTLIQVMRPGSRIALHSTILPETCIALEELCVARGIGLIDAPVSGGAAGAAAGTLTIMCGGKMEILAACRPVFESFARLISWLGEVGAGQRAKILNNALLAANIGTAYAAVAAGTAMGLDAAALTNVLKASSGYSFGLEVSGNFPVPADFPGGALLTKDVGLLTQVLPRNTHAEVLRDAAASFLPAIAPGYSRR